MKQIPSRPPTKLREWRVSIIRKRLGRVAAADREAAQVAAAEEFKLNDEQLRRVILSGSAVARATRLTVS